jgi:hypothetical protein
MNDPVWIYIVVVLNALLQVLLIRRLWFPPGRKWKFILAALAIPVLIALAMRLIVAAGWMPQQVAEQSPLQRGVTLVASALLMLGPWLVTIAAVVDKKRRAALAVSMAAEAAKENGG